MSKKLDFPDYYLRKYGTYVLLVLLQWHRLDGQACIVCIKFGAVCPLFIFKMVDNTIALNSCPEISISLLFWGGIPWHCLPLFKVFFRDFLRRPLSFDEISQLIWNLLSKRQISIGRFCQIFIAVFASLNCIDKKEDEQHQINVLQTLQSRWYVV